MKTAKLVFTFLLVAFFALTVIAQQEDNQLYYCIKNTVKPEKIDEYKELMKKLASACKEHNYPFTYSVWQSTHPDFYFFWPVKDYNEGKELMNEAWGSIIPNMEQDWGAKYSETLDGWDDFFIKAIDNLSYDPETNADGLDYGEWWIRYLQPGTWDQYTNAFKHSNEMAKKGNFEYPCGRFSNDIGMKGPAIISVFWGKNPFDLYDQLFKDWERLGEEAREMIYDLSSTTRKFEKISFWRQKDLSYTPE